MLSPRARKSDNYRKGNKEKKQGNYTKNKAKPNKSDNFIRSKREKNWIAPVLFCILGAPIIFLPTIEAEKAKRIEKSYFPTVSKTASFIFSNFVLNYFCSIYSVLVLCTVGENIIATIKMRNNFWYPLKMVIFPLLR